MSTRSKLLEKTGDLQLPEADLPPLAPVAAPAVATAQPAAAAGPFAPPAIATGQGGARTAPGRMLAFREHAIHAETEINKLREQLQEFDGASATRRLDATTVIPSQWANRHADSFRNASFESLKQDIAQSGGNVQPIAVRAAAGQPGRWEIIFGHRRHRACLDLGLPVLATVVAEPMGEMELFAAMDRENREREDLSPYEQGRMYRKALDEKLYPSIRRLAEALAVSHTWVGNVLAVADLPQVVVECFRSPLDITHRHAKALTAAMDQDRKAVLRRAERIQKAGERLPAAQAIQALCRSSEVEHENGPRAVIVNGKRVGSWRRGRNGNVQVEIAGAAASDDAVQHALEALGAALGG